MKIHYFVKNNYWLIIAVLLSFLLIVLWFASLSEIELQTFFSSDALYLPSIYQDIFVDGNSFEGWTLNPAPNFFPDMLFFFILMGITCNFVISAFLFSIIQYFVIIFLFYAIFRKISSISPSVFALTLYLFSFFLFIFLTNNDDFYYSFLILSNSYHNGMFVMSLTCLLLTLVFLKKESWTALIAIFLLSAISYPSDKLFLIVYTCPILFTCIVLLIGKYNKKKTIKLIITCISGILLGMVISNQFAHNPVFNINQHHHNFDIDSIITSWTVFFDQMKSFLLGFSFKSLIIIFSMISYIWTIYYCTSQFVKIKQGKNAISLLFIFEVFVLFFVPIVLLTPILDGNYFNGGVIRYNYFVFIVLLFNFVLQTIHFFEEKRYILIGVNCFCSIAISMYLIWSIHTKDFISGLQNYFTFYSEYARNLDAQFQDNSTPVYGITNDYWYGKHATMFSKNEVRLYTISSNATPPFYVNNQNWFYGSNNSKYGNPEFTFLLWHKNESLPVFFTEQNPPYESRMIDKYRILYFVQPFRFDKETKQPKLLGKE